MLRPLDLETLRREFAAAKPYPHIKIDNFIDARKAHEIAAAYPTFDIALNQGKTFTTVNERKKVQISDPTLFSDPVSELNNFLASPKFLSDLAYITGVPNVLPDEQLIGGGIHVTGPGGRLDVHVDFNYIEERKLHRRLNLLLYLNPVWEEGWGGHFQVWDKDVQRCEAAFSPSFNRCVIFETSDISYHGVVPVSESAPVPRKSFATYYYTKEAPAHWTGVAHSTVFKARPDERLRGMILMPAESAKGKMDARVNRLKDKIKKLIKR